MKKTKSKLVAAVLSALLAAAVAVAAFPCAVSPAYANSGHRYEYGVTGTGVIVKHEQSALAVESEKLTFNLVDYPDYPYVDGYKSTVTAEYAFVNTSNETVKTCMAFPIGTDPSCYGGVADPIIKVNGDIIPVETRHTLGGYGEFDEKVKDILDGLYEDDFYKPDMPVTRYTVGVDTAKDKDYRCVGEYTCDASRARIIGLVGDGEIIAWVNGKQAAQEDKAREESSSKGDVKPFPLDFEDMDDRSFYVVGDTSAFSCEWHSEKYVPSFKFNSCYSYTLGDYRKTGVGVTVTETGKTTLKELVLYNRKADSAVSETDWYNGILQNLFSHNKDRASAAQSNNLRRSDENFLAWYNYDVVIEPNGKVVNSVTAPIFPSLRYGYDPYRYDYEYYLSPAQSWKSFGTLTVEVNTDYFMLEPPDGFEKRDGGYTATFNGLPEGELEFMLCSVEEPNYVGNHTGGIPIIVIAVIFFGFFGVAAIVGIVVVIVCLVRAHKKKKTNQS